jgi:hypothetical protein
METRGSWRGFRQADQATSACTAAQRIFGALIRMTFSRIMMDVSHPNQRGIAIADLPSQGLSDMSFDNTLSGRMERRLPIIVVVRLAQAENAGTDGEERTYTDNISPRGARLFSTRSWKPGDPVRIAPRDEDPAFGNVVYCQALADGRFIVGVNFQDRPITWSAMHRYDGLQTSLAAKSQSS